ncbi:MAG: sensor histidine kinase [Jatrophihabitans sp.]
MLDALSLHNRPTLWRALRLVALAAVVVGIVVRSPDGEDASVKTLIWLTSGLAAVGWIGWVLTTPGSRTGARLASLSLLVAAGCMAGGADPAGPAIALGGVGVFAATLVLPPVQAATLFVLGLITMAVGHVVGGATVTLAAFLAALVGVAVGGFNRRIYRERLMRQADRLVAQTSRTQAELARSAMLSERARIAREIHDVLAHSLGALAVQLDAADALFIDGGADPVRAHQHVTRARALAVEGLNESRRAIHALRDHTAPITEQLGKLVAEHTADTGTPADLVVEGTQRQLAPDVSITVYRTAQEALTNCRKHAPSAPVRLALRVDRDGAGLTVSNPVRACEQATLTLASAGGGYGLTGLAERAALLGGALQAAEVEQTWTVDLWLPT